MAAVPLTAAMVTAAFEATASKATPVDADPFQKGESVVYPAHGLGRVESVGFEEIAGKRLDLIQISFDGSQMTLRIPVAQARAAGLRKIVSDSAMAAALARLKSEPRISRLIWAKRSQGYIAKINTGDPAMLAEVVRDLYSAGDPSGGSFSQRNLFELALDRLSTEFAFVSQICKEQAVEQLNKVLADSRVSQATVPEDLKERETCQ